MPVEYMTCLIGCEIKITTEPNFYGRTCTFVSVARARAIGCWGPTLLVETPSGGLWNLPERHRPRSTKKMFILDLCGRAKLEVDYR